MAPILTTFGRLILGRRSYKRVQLKTKRLCIPCRIQTTAAAVMEKAPHSILFLLLVVNFCAADQDTTRGRAEEFHVGVILDLGSLVGKVARTSISLAVEDFYMVHRNYSTRLVLHFRDSMASDVRAASAGMCPALNC